MNVRTLAVTLLATPILALPLVADVVYDESVSGDLSGDPGSPTVIAVEGETVLVVRGSVQSGTGSDTRDFFSMTVAEGATLEAIRLVDYVDGVTGAPGNTGYFMVDDGATSVVPSSSTSSAFLGGSHCNRTRFPTAEVNMLERLSRAVQGGTGFSYPPGPGTYTFNMQQTGSQQNVYEFRFEFGATAAPCPADLDGDGRVDGGDLGLFLGAWGTSPCDLDLNGDGICNGADLGVLLGAWGDC